MSNICSSGSSQLGNIDCPNQVTRHCADLNTFVETHGIEAAIEEFPDQAAATQRNKRKANTVDYSHDPRGNKKKTKRSYYLEKQFQTNFEKGNTLYKDLKNTEATHKMIMDQLKYKAAEIRSHLEHPRTDDNIESLRSEYHDILRLIFHPEMGKEYLLKEEEYKDADSEIIKVYISVDEMFAVHGAANMRRVLDDQLNAYFEGFCKK